MLVLIGIGVAWLSSLHSSKGDWELANVRGHLPDLQFALVDDRGRAVTAEDYRGKVTLLYFGFTGCSFQCPPTLARLTQVFKKMGPAADKVQLLFVTIDPSGDRPDILTHYLAAFDSHHMAGLTGNPHAIAQLAKRYRAIYDADGQGGNRPHSNVVYIFDKHGAARLLMTPGDHDAALVHDLNGLAHEQ